MLKQRVITALILALLFVFVLVAVPPALFPILIMLAVLVAGWEWAKLASINSALGKGAFLLILTLLLFLAYYLLQVSGDFNRQLSYQICLFALALWAVILLWIQGYPSSAILWANSPIIICMGLIILTTTWIAFTAIFLYDNGQWLLGLAILVVVLADLGGYFVGNLFGRHKLAELVSPGKTREGFVGGLVLQLFLILFLKMVMPGLSVVDLAILIIPVALASVVGDLFESMLKRHSGVKDSSSLLPGHGGVLDRIDGVMAALPMFWVLLLQSKAF